MQNLGKQSLRAMGSIIVALLITGCEGAFLGTPTPEAWAPPTSTAAPVVAEPTVAPVAEEPLVERETVVVQRGTIANVLTLNGQVVPRMLRDLAFRQSGVLRTLYVEPGMPVEQAQLLAELDLGTLPDQLREARIVAEQDQLLISREAENGQIAVSRAEIALEDARANLSELQAPVAPAEIARARAEMEQAQAALARTRNDASAVKTRAERAYNDAVRTLEVTQQEHAAAQAALAQAASEANQQRERELARLVQQAETQVALTRIDFDTALGNEIAAVSAAQATLDLAQANLERLLAPPDRFAIAEAERAVRLGQVQLTEARQQARPNPELTKRLAASQLAVKEIESQIENRRIYAPFSGTITAIDAQPSFPVQAEIPIIALMDDSGLEVVVTGINGVSAEQISVGMTVALRFSQHPDQQVVGSITRTPSGMSGSTALPVFNIGYTTDLPLAIGDQVQVTFDFGDQANVLWLPPTAIRRDTSDYVIVLDGNDERRVDVLVGTVTADQVEIRSGLNQGDQIVLPNS